MIEKLNIIPLEDWLDYKTKPLIISGPCSAETEEQILETARRLKLYTDVKIFRAGVWKPRTRPKMFEGVGKNALEWLKKVKEETGLLIAVEVANTYHVDECLKNNIDIIWLGARTTVNPFSVQEIADSLKGVDIPVFIKNPINPDVELWIGVIERIYNSGISKIVAVHRGFNTYEKTQYRNAPIWEIPIELKRIFPNLPIICDPSHICGNKEMLLSVSQKALDLEMDGLMIESHFNPESALTDANQQITPAELKTFIDKLIIRKILSENTSTFSKLEELRINIDKIDDELLEILVRRMKIIEEIGYYKRDNNLTILQMKRWKNVFSDRIQKAVDLGLDKKFITTLLDLVHNESIQKQEDIMNKREKP